MVESISNQKRKKEMFIDRKEDDDSNRTDSVAQW